MKKRVLTLMITAMILGNTVPTYSFAETIALGLNGSKKSAAYSIKDSYVLEEDKMIKKDVDKSIVVHHSSYDEGENTDSITFEMIQSMTEDEIKTLFANMGMNMEKGYVVWTKNALLNRGMMGDVLIYILPDTDVNGLDDDVELFWEKEKLMETLGLPRNMFEIDQLCKEYICSTDTTKTIIQCRIVPQAYDVEEIAELKAAALNTVQFSPYYVDFVNDSMGGFNTPQNVKGDANCDGQVDMGDAVLIMQALANPNKYGMDGAAEHHLTEQGKLNGDMDGNGLTVDDANAIQVKLLGLC